MTEASRLSPAAPRTSEADMIRAVGLRNVIREDLRQHRGQVFAPGFQALFFHRVGVYATTTRRPLRSLLYVVYSAGSLFCRNFFGIELERSVNVGRRLLLGHQHGIVIHSYASIGDDCVIRQGVTFGVGTEWITGKGPIIGDRVQFGVGTVVVGNVTIGDDVTIGPNCVITRDVPPNCTLFVAPPRAIPKASPEMNADVSGVVGSIEPKEDKIATIP